MCTRWLPILGLSLSFFGCAHVRSDSTLPYKLSVTCWVKWGTGDDLSIAVSNLNSFPVVCAYPDLRYCLHYEDDHGDFKEISRTIRWLYNWKPQFVMLDKQTRPGFVIDTGTVFYSIPMPRDVARLSSLDIELDSMPFASLAKYKTSSELMYELQNSYTSYNFAFPSNMPMGKVTSIRGTLKCQTP